MRSLDRKGRSICAMTDKRQAVILAGGKGTRLASRLDGAPKPLIDVDGLPLLERQIRALAAYGFDDVIILVNYRADAIEGFCRTLDMPKVNVTVVQDGNGARGTAGAVWDAVGLLHDRFLVIYGDTLFDIDLDRFWGAHKRAQHDHGALGTLFLHPNDHPYDSDLVGMDEGGKIAAFYSKPHPEGSFHRNMVNAALYVLEKKLLDEVSADDGVVDFGKDVFPKALAMGLTLHGYATFEYIKDIGTPDRLDRAVADLRSGKVFRSRLSMPQQAVFLDRDGTLNIPNGHIATPEGLELIEGVGSAVARLNRAEYRCVLVTNQPVLARGECTSEQLHEIHAKLETGLGLSAGFLDASYVCPHYPESGFPGEVAELKIACDCRKPSPGLLVRAIADLSIDPERSWMIGDSSADIHAAQAVGVRSILVRTGGKVATALDVQPTYELHDVPAAVDFILGGHAKLCAELAPLAEGIKAGALIRVSGVSRSGKSLLASALIEVLREQGKAAALVQMDRWLLPGDNRPKDQGPISCFDWDRLKADLSSWLQGGALDIGLPAYDPKGAMDLPELSLSLPSDGILVLDGTLASHFVETAQRVSLDVFVEASEEERRDRFIREYQRRGLEEEAIMALYRKRDAEERPLVERQKERADIVMHGSSILVGKIR